MRVNISLLKTFMSIISMKCAKISLLFVLQNVNVANEVAHIVSIMNSSYHELSI